MPIFYQKLIKPYGSHRLINSLDGKNLEQIFENIQNFQFLPYQKEIVLDVITTKLESWKNINNGTNAYLSRYTPGSISVIYTPSSYDFFTTSSTTINPTLSSDINGIIVSTCGVGGKSNTPGYTDSGTMQPCGGAGSGGYIVIVIPPSFTYNGVTYILNPDNGIQYNTDSTSINYSSSDSNNTFTIQLSPGNGQNVAYNEPASAGGFASLSVSNTSIPESLYLLSKFLTNGVSGTNYSNGTVSSSYNGYTQGGAGVNTSGYYTTGGSYTTGYYPKGLNVTNQPTQNEMTLYGSNYSVTSRAASTNNGPSGYGAGGSVAPANYSVDGVSASTLRLGTSGFIEVMAVIIDN